MILALGLGLILASIFALALWRLLPHRGGQEFFGAQPDRMREERRLLDLQYARGEIDREEYEWRKRLISG